MLIFGRGQFGPHVPWALLALVLTVAGAAWYAAESVAAGELVRGSSRAGLSLGVAGALLILFEMLIWPRKRLPWMRTLPLGRTKGWLRAHIWLGLLVAPFALLHTGFRWGGPLPAATSVVLILVLVSGVWGLVLQNILPRRMLELVPGETPLAEIERVMARHSSVFAESLKVDSGGLGSAPKPGSEAVAAFYENRARPYLLGQRRPLELRSAPQAVQLFAAQAAKLPPDALPRLRELAELCELRRQLDTSARLHWWLHNWVWVHLPLSVALCALLAAHAFTALKYM